jgi:hypothetical protein
VSARKSVGPSRWSQFGSAKTLLNHLRVNVAHADLEQIETQHSHFLILSLIGGKLAAFPVENKAVDAIPEFDGVRQRFVMETAR